MKLYSATIKQQDETGLQGHYHQDLTVLENPIVLFVLTSESPILAYPYYINASHQYRPTFTILMRSVPDFGPTFKSTTGFYSEKTLIYCGLLAA